MNKLQALVSKKRKAAREAGGEKKWAKRTEREELERYGKQVGAPSLEALRPASFARYSYAPLCRL